MKFRTLGAVLLIGALLSCATLSTTGIGVDRVDGSYTADGINWSGGGAMIFALKVHEHNGMAAVCGAYTPVGETAYGVRFNDQLVQGSTIEIAGDRLASNLSFMSAVREGKGLDGALANCVVTSAPWKAAYAKATPNHVALAKTYLYY